MKKYEIDVNGQVYQITLKEISEEDLQQVAQGKTELTTSKDVDTQQSEGKAVYAPMAGNILSIKVRLGDRVQKGDTLVILEAMKMENEVVAPMDGVVKEIKVSENQGVESNQILVKI